jgi:Domain of unknown function (DUF4468) with TBP-like fold
MFTTLMSLSCFAQTKVIQLDSTYTKDILFEKTKLFVAKTFNNSTAVLDYTNKTDGTIIVKGSFTAHCVIALFGDMPYGYVTFNIQFDFKDGKARYMVSNKILEVRSQYGITKYYWDKEDDTIGSSRRQDMKDNFDKEMADYLNHYEYELKNTPLKEDW